LSVSFAGDARDSVLSGVTLHPLGGAHEAALSLRKTHFRVKSGTFVVA
jgi:hypothetical protein